MVILQKQYHFLMAGRINLISPYEGLEFPIIATRICAINRTNAKMGIQFYAVLMYRNLNIDIKSVAKILPTEERL